MPGRDCIACGESNSSETSFCAGCGQSLAPALEATPLDRPDGPAGAIARHDFDRTIGEIIDTPPLRQSSTGLDLSLTYQITRVIGHCGELRAYRAEGLHNGPAVILKGRIGEADHVRLAERAEALSGIDSPYVVPVRAVWKGEAGDTYGLLNARSDHLVSALITPQPATPEYATMLSAPPPTLSQIRDALFAGLRGLAALHEAGLVHARFGPDSLLKSETADDTQVQLIPIACWHHASAPEAFFGDYDKLTPAADVHDWCRSFKGHLADRFNWPGLGNTIEAGTAYSKEKRPPDAAALLSALGHLETIDLPDRPWRA